MINITDKAKCVGCNACMQRCPKECITMETDSAGFKYPVVNHDLCIDCHLCERVCPVLNQSDARYDFNILAAVNQDNNIRATSSSGGIFYPLAAAVIADGGVVFGARFDDSWNVIHDYTETTDGLRALMGSKYVQSDIGDTYGQAEKFLQAGRRVLFSGTPCQIAGLRLFLRKDYSGQLLTVDILCHGVPSPLVYRRYLGYLTEEHGGIKAIESVSFRDKHMGWEQFGFSLTTADGHRYFAQNNVDTYTRGFLKNIYLRPSCHKCPVKSGKSMSDITLGDYWKSRLTQPEVYDRDGVSLIFVNTPQGEAAVRSLNLKVTPATYGQVAVGNQYIHTSVATCRYTSAFWRNFDSRGIEYINVLLDKLRPSIFVRGFRKARRLLGLQ